MHVTNGAPIPNLALSLSATFEHEELYARNNNEAKSSGGR